MKVKILKIKNSISKRKIGEIIEAKRLYELTNEELEESIGYIPNDESLWEKNDIFIHEEGNYYVYMLENEIEIIGE